MSDIVETAQKSINRETKKLYSKARKELQENLSGLLDSLDGEISKAKTALDAGTLTESEYRQNVINILVRNGIRRKAKDYAKSLYKANHGAVEAINSKTSAMIADGLSREAYQAEMDTGMDYGLYPMDEDDIGEWMEENPDIFPLKTIDEAKDKRWNSRNITNSLFSDILLGVAVGMIAKKTAERVIERNRNSMEERTYEFLSGAWEYGRDIMIGEEKRNGMETVKEWSATLDFKTRDAHRELDGRRVPENQPFVVDGEEIWYPRDPAAPAYLRCNCRCGMRTIHPRYDVKTDRRENIRTYHPDGTWEKRVIPYMTYNQWYEMKRQQMGDVEIQRQIKQMRQEQRQRYYRQRRRRRQDAI